jgi:hypothetical protein
MSAEMQVLTVKGVQGFFNANKFPRENSMPLTTLGLSGLAQKIAGEMSAHMAGREIGAKAGGVGLDDIDAAPAASQQYVKQDDGMSM